MDFHEFSEGVGGLGTRNGRLDFGGELLVTSLTWFNHLCIDGWLYNNVVLNCNSGACG